MKQYMCDRCGAIIDICELTKIEMKVETYPNVVIALLLRIMSCLLQRI